MLVALAGGVGAARFLRGLVQVVAPADLTVVVNTGCRLPTGSRVVRGSGGPCELAMQEWFGRERAGPPVLAVRFDGADRARPAPGVLEALAGADTILVCPSNPVISIGPILAVPG